jgi:NADH dehydrogenase [ubiquinone] 1 alpha subcomplex assembly factor 7
MPSLLIRTDLQEHLDWIESQRPSFDPQKPPDFDPDPSGIVKRDLTESIINLTDMYDPRLHTSLNDEDGRYELATPLSRELEAYIAVRAAPISVAEYMRQALTHPLHGYYTNPTSNDDDDWDNQEWEEGDATPDQFIIGSKGDFVTAPEVSQVFGECICVWFVTQWQAMGKPKELQIVEVGPGKGTLISDICRSAMTSFTDFGDSLQKIHLVEASAAMRSEQERKLQALSNDHVQFVFEASKDSVLQVIAKEEAVSQDTSSDPKQDADKRTILVRWHDSFASVMRESSSESLPTLVLCQEFIDALPVHVFEKTNDGWRERMVDIASRIEADDDKKDSNEEDKMVDSSQQDKDQQKEKMLRLRYVLSPDTTPALRTLLNVSSSGKMENDNSEVGSICEVCPQGILLAQDIAQLLSKTRGSALIFDYGHEGSTDSIRAFSRHEQVPALSRPGQVDVTADVDFAALRHAVNVSAQGDDPHAFGPVSQGKFLASMGIVERVSGLIEDDNTTDEQAEDLYNALERLVLPEHMGERYKVMAIAKKKDGIFGPPGF